MSMIFGFNEADEFEPLPDGVRVESTQILSGGQSMTTTDGEFTHTYLTDGDG